MKFFSLFGFIDLIFFFISLRFFYYHEQSYRWEKIFFAHKSCIRNDFFPFTASRVIDSRKSKGSQGNLYDFPITSIAQSA